MSTTENTKGYVAFVNELIKRFADLQIPLVPVQDVHAKDGLRGPNNWVLFEVPNTGDKLYLARSAGKPRRAETSVPFDELPPQVVVKDMRTLNGKIEASVVADIDVLAAGLLPIMADRLGRGARIRENRAPVRK